MSNRELMETLALFAPGRWLREIAIAEVERLAGEGRAIPRAARFMRGGRSPRSASGAAAKGR